MTIQVKMGKKEEQVFNFENEQQALNLVSYFLKNKYFNFTKYYDCVEEERILIRVINEHSIEV
jgi:uncharacterized protein YkuJ